jgi:hypothetical protein
VIRLVRCRIAQDHSPYNLKISRKSTVHSESIEVSREPVTQSQPQFSFIQGSRSVTTYRMTKTRQATPPNPRTTAHTRHNRPQPPANNVHRPTQPQPHVCNEPWSVSYDVPWPAHSMLPRLAHLEAHLEVLGFLGLSKQGEHAVSRSWTICDTSAHGHVSRGRDFFVGSLRSSSIHSFPLHIRSFVWSWSEYIPRCVGYAQHPFVSTWTSR